MSVDKAFRKMIRREVESYLRPIQNAVSRLQESAHDLHSLRDLAARLAPLGSLIGGRIAGRRGPGRPPGSGRKARRAGLPGKRTRAETGANDRPCALMGCKRQARSKGYCAAHYQKYSNLSRTRRLPSDWKEHAPPHSVKDIVLPRGRAAVKALRARKSRG